MMFALSSNSFMSLSLCMLLCLICLCISMLVRISGTSFVLCPASFPKVHCTSKWRWIDLSAFCRTTAVWLMCIIYCICAKAWTYSCVYVHLCLLRLSHLPLPLWNLEYEHMKLASCIVKHLCVCVFTVCSCLDYIVHNRLLMARTLGYQRPWKQHHPSAVYPHKHSVPYIHIHIQIHRQRSLALEFVSVGLLVYVYLPMCEAISVQSCTGANLCIMLWWLMVKHIWIVSAPTCQM